MVIRITWGLVLIGLGLVVGGFLTTDSNILLILAIAFEIAAIVLVLATWARRAREGTALGFEDDIVLADEPDEDADDEVFAPSDEETDEEFAVGPRRRSRSSRRTRRPSEMKSRTKSKPKAKSSSSRSKSKSKSTKSKASKSKSTKSKAKSTKSKAKKKPSSRKKSTSSKPKAKRSSRPKSKAPRRRSSGNG